MANIKSQIKRNRQNEKRRLRNRDFRGAARTAVKGANVSMGSGEETLASVMAAVSALDKAAQKGAIHPRNAARRKGRLMKHLAALGPQILQPKPAVTEPVTPARKKAKEAKPSKTETEFKPNTETAVKSVVKKTAEKKPVAKKTPGKK